MDARTSRYHEVYARWQRDPQGFWGEAAAEPSTGSKSRRPCSIRRPASTAAGFRTASATPASTPSTARSMPGAANRRRSFTIHRSPAQSARSPITACLTETQVLGGMLRDLGVRKGRSRHSLHADGAGSRDRDARLRAHRRHPFGRVRRLRGARTGDPHRRRHAEGHSRPRAAASSPAASCITSRCSTRRSRCRQAQAGRLPDPAAPAGAGGADRRPRSRLGGDARSRARPCPLGLRLRAGRGHRSALYSLHVRHDRPAEGRGARQWRPHGRAEMVDEKSLRHRSRRSVVDGVRYRLGGRPFLHRLRAAVAWRDHHPL